ncbi:MAG: cytidylate kinase [Phormidesmis priestleyi]|uniref:Bifunctional pantoate ligase/cytidylate kinase n=1 Tax=Phormidesmis priestleyi TaxID=268141 RepID=A0A2W4XAL6_9CYAN|nr:MAG: cytidylate kinase [Phormidesmis priestleyi]
MQLLNTVTELRHYLTCALIQRSGQTVGLVPTMGALHAGHLSLIARSRQINDIVVVSIFVNPLQFGPNEDLDRYPRSEQADQALCQSAGVDVLFMPSPEELYGSAQPDLSTVTQVVPPPSMTRTLCGRSRPGHFQGVATVVTKLLNIVRPTHAFFGQKDAQQVAILRRLRRDLNLPGEIVVCPIVREPSGLAMSSRNRYLNAAQRQQATVLYRSLQAAQTAFQLGHRSQSVLLKAAEAVLQTEPAVILDYLALVHPDTLEPLQAIDTVGMMAIAAYIGKTDTSPSEQAIQQATGNSTRLLDNLVLEAAKAPVKAPDKEPSPRKPLVAIDGPAGAGKSTVARQIAHQLGLLYLDTGAMYRALTWFALQHQVEVSDERAIADLLPQCQIQLIANIENDRPLPPKVLVNGQDVTDAIRTAAVTSQVSAIAAHASVRSHLVQQQQQYGLCGGVVADGRDVGTQVFPDAELKIYLTASVQERAQRRYRDLAVAQQPLPDLSELTQAIAERDHKDSHRSVSPLRKATDAVEIVTDDYTAEQVIEKITHLYQQLTA